MFDTKKFGAYICRMRKNADMTQYMLAEKLDVTRESVVKYEDGSSFPDVSKLALLSDIFGVPLDEIINGGEPSKGEAAILEEIASGSDKIKSLNVSDIVNLAPLLRPSVLAKLAKGLKSQGIDISSIVELVEYLNEESTAEILENADFNSIDEKMLSKLVPLLDEKSKTAVFEKILSGEIDWHMIKVLLPYAYYISSQVEAAVMEGALPWEALEVLREGQAEYTRLQNEQ